MKKRIVIIILSTFLIMATLIGIGILSNINRAEEDNEIDNNQKIIVARIIIDNNKENESDNSKDSTISDQMFNIYKELFNSAAIKDKVRQKYPDSNDIELDRVKDSEIIRVIYVCEEYSEEECIEIEKMFIKEFSNKIREAYGVNVYIIDEPEVAWREI